MSAENSGVEAHAEIIALSTFSRMPEDNTDLPPGIEADGEVFDYGTGSLIGDTYSLRAQATDDELAVSVGLRDQYADQEQREGISDDFEENESNRLWLIQLLGILRPEEQQAVVLRHYAEFSRSDTALMMGLPRRKVDRLVDDALHKMRAHVRESGLSRTALSADLSSSSPDQ